MEQALTSQKSFGLQMQTVLKKIYKNYWLRRIIRMLFTIWTTTTLIFFLIRLMPGNPYDLMVQEMMITRGMTQEEAQDEASKMTGINMDEPILLQYSTYMKNLLKGDLGTSYRSPGKSVTELVLARLPWTLALVGISLLVSFTIGIILGTIIAYRRGGIADNLLSSMAAIFDAIPSYLIAIVVFMLLGVILKIYPISLMRGATSPGVRIDFSPAFFADAFKHMLVPMLVYILSTVGSWILTMKSSTVSVLGEDFVTAARARGLKSSRILTSYVGRTAILPLVTRLAISIGFVMGGSVLIEQIFTYQGIGMLLWQAISQRDYPLMQAVFLVTTVAVVAANFVADILYGWLDPRVRTGSN